MSGDYPEGFTDWPLERRNAYFADEGRKYNERKRAEKTPMPLPLEPQSREPRPYPVAALGDVLGGAAQSIAAKCQCAPALAAQSVLAVASLAAQRLADVRMPYGQTRPLSLFLFTVAASGERKSTADNEALIPVRMHEKNLRQRLPTGPRRLAHCARCLECRTQENRGRQEARQAVARGCAFRTRPRAG